MLIVVINLAKFFCKIVYLFFYNFINNVRHSHYNDLALQIFEKSHENCFTTSITRSCKLIPSSFWPRGIKLTCFFKKKKIIDVKYEIQFLHYAYFIMFLFLKIDKGKILFLPI